MIEIPIKNMMDELLKEIKVCLKNECYIVALSNALILPDICSKAEYPNLKKTSERYKKWLDEYLNKKIIGLEPQIVHNKISAELIYKLRCAVLHEGNPNVEKKQSDYFELIIDEEDRGSHIVFAVEEQVDLDNNMKYQKISLNLREWCLRLCMYAEDYYLSNKEKFNFFNYNICDCDFKTRETFFQRYWK